MYRLTDEGVKKCKDFIVECRAKRRKILEEKKDTAKYTKIPTIKDITSDINMFGVDDDNEYFNCFGITDNYNSDSFYLTLGVDFEKVKVKAINIKWDIDLQHNETYKDAVEECGLPTEVEIPKDIDDDDITDWLSDKYGFCISRFKVEPV